MKRTLASLVLAGALATGFGAAASAQDRAPVKIGWTAWSDAEFVTKLAEKLITEEFGVDVELVQTDIAPQYQGVAQGDIDVMLMAWLPGTHADYWERVGTQVDVLGVLYTDARLGWAVPSYVPEEEVASIADLANDDVRSKLGGRIQGIDPGAGLTRLSGEAIDAYGLDDYQLVTASDAAMVAALDRAVRRDEWIVVTTWSPHWMFGAYDLRYLDDPEGALGGVENIYAIARRDFQADHPDVARMLMRMHISLDDLEAAMFEAQENSYAEAIESFVEANPELIAYWTRGEIGGS